MLTILRMFLAFEQHRFNVDAIWSAPCIDVHTMIYRHAKTIWRFSPFFSSVTFLSISFLFNLFCFSSLWQRVVLLNFLDTKVNPYYLLFSQRERRESRRSPVVRGWSGGAMVLSELSVPRRATNLDNNE